MFTERRPNESLEPFVWQGIGVGTIFCKVLQMGLVMSQKVYSNVFMISFELNFWVE